MDGAIIFEMQIGGSQGGALLLSRNDAFANSGRAVQNAENKLSQIRSGIPAVEDSLVEGETDLRELSRELAPLSEKIEDIQVEELHQILPSRLSAKKKRSWNEYR